MDTAMRDLDQLRERGDETTGRKVGLFTMAAILSVSAVFAMGIMIGRGDGAAAETAPDPLAQLALTPAKAEGRRESGAEEPVDVRPESLSFPNTLVDRREDPLVEATVRAAEAEHASLTAPSEAAPALAERVEAASQLTAPSTADLPAGSMASEDAQRLTRVAKHDPLVAQALPREADVETAPQGREGAFVLQVVSYDSARQAEQFASTLRARGHTAFVMRAEVPGRGRFHRVRIGPFKTRQDAANYQKSFESKERMHTILVANQPQ